MSDTLIMIFVTVVAFFVIIPITFFGNKRFRAKLKIDMQKCAEALNLTYVDEPPAFAAPSGMEQSNPNAVNLLTMIAKTVIPWHISGNRDGIAVQIHTVTKSSNRNQTTWTVITAYFPNPLPYKLHMGAENILTKFGAKVMNLRDIEAGDPAFDNLVRVKSDNPGAVQSLISNPMMRDETVKLFSWSRDAEIFEGGVRYERIRHVRDPAVLEEILAHLVPCAKAFSD